MSILVFTPFERELLKLASKETQSVAKSAKLAAKKAYLTEGESEAHELMGYAEEAVRFLDAPEGPNNDEVHLAFGHRTALRTGCLIKIGDIESIADEQTDCLVDADGISATRKRAEDYRRLEARLRTMDNPQTEIPLDTPSTPPAPTDDAARGATDAATDVDDGPIIGEGPFDADAVRERLALSAPAVDLNADIPEAEIEELPIDDPNDPTSDAWLDVPLREGTAPAPTGHGTTDDAELLDDDDDPPAQSLGDVLADAAAAGNADVNADVARDATPYADDAAIDDDDPTAAST
jgi:hypothetical protein